MFWRSVCRGRNSRTSLRPRNNVAEICSRSQSPFRQVSVPRLDKSAREEGAGRLQTLVLQRFISLATWLLKVTWKSGRCTARCMVGTGN